MNWERTLACRPSQPSFTTVHPKAPATAPGFSLSPAGSTANRRPTYAAVKAMMAGAQSPLDFLLGVMRDESHDIQLRVLAAKAAAPYVHRSLKSVEQGGAGGGPQRIEVTWIDPQSPDPST